MRCDNVVLLYYEDKVNTHVRFEKNPLVRHVVKIILVALTRSHSGKNQTVVRLG